MWLNNANPAHTPGSTKKRASHSWGALCVFLLLVLAPSREPGPSGPSEAVFPLPERFEGSYKNDWGETRAQGKHEGADVFAPEGTPIRSITDGTVVRARGSDEDGWNSSGGYAVLVEAAFDAGLIRHGDLLYYAHLKAQSGLRMVPRSKQERRWGKCRFYWAGAGGKAGALRAAPAPGLVQGRLVRRRSFLCRQRGHAPFSFAASAR